MPKSQHETSTLKHPETLTNLHHKVAFLLLVLLLRLLFIHILFINNAVFQKLPPTKTPPNPSKPVKDPIEKPGCPFTKPPGPLETFLKDAGAICVAFGSITLARGSADSFQDKAIAAARRCGKKVLVVDPQTEGPEGAG